MRLYRAALGGLAVVLLLLAGFGIGSARRTDRAAHRASSATELSNAYEEARFAVGEEESLERKYRLEPGPEVRAKHRRASRDLGAALVDIGRIGTPADRALVTRLLAVHRTYLAAIDRLFVAVDRHEVKRVLAIDGGQVDPLFGLIVDRVDDASRAHREVTARSLRDLRGTERSALTATPVVFALGLLLLAFFTVLVTRINRRLARQARESDHNARHDAMTGLPNRAELGRQVGRAIAATADDPAPFSVQMIDLDRFKEINDTLGHTTGDRLLREIASRLQPFVGPADTLARVGGDEFGLLSASVGADDAQAMAGRIAAALREPFAVDELSLTIDVSIGIVTYPAHGDDAETLLRRAGIAGHMAKGSDRAAALYDPTADHYDPERLRLAGELRRAIDEDELELHYQPKFAISGLRVAGAEALVRWQHPTRGLLAPGEFISLAEDTGLIRPLTLLVLRKAARQARAWLDEALDIPVAVNLSAANLQDHELIDDVLRILAEEELPPGRLELEITESTVMTDPEHAIATLDRLAAMGIRLSIDDYGTGHSALAYLRRLPVHELKIDRSFIGRLSDGGADLQIVRSTIDLGHNLGLRVVAEGVEDAQTLVLLQWMNCDFAQGFHLSRPVAPDALRRQLDDLPAVAAFAGAIEGL